MRRPLCFAVLVYTLSLWVILQLAPGREELFSDWEKQRVWAEGTVVSREYRSGTEGAGKLLVSLKNVTIRKKNETGTGKNEEMEETEENGLEPETMLLCRVGAKSREKAEELDEALSVGSRVLMKGTFRTFSPATNAGEFDAATYYRSMGYGAQMTGAELIQSIPQELSPGPSAGSALRTVLWNSFAESMYRLRRHLGNILSACLPGQSAEIVRAMLLGERGGLDPELKDLYQGAGIVHILAISGLHITLIGMGVFHLLRKLRCSFPASAVTAAAVILLYGQLTGNSPSSFRAITMFLLRMLALLCHRTYDLLTALAVAALLLLIQEPLYLYHSGFLFSFSAVLGIALLAPAFDSRPMKGLCVILATLPVSLQEYGMISPYAFFLNLAVLPLMSVVMTGGLLVLFLGSFSVLAGKSAGIVPVSILALYEILCRGSRRLPFSQVILGAPSAGQIVIYVGILGAICFLPALQQITEPLWKKTKPLRKKTNRAEEKEKRMQGEERLQKENRKPYEKWTGSEKGRILLAAAAVFILLLRVQNGLEIHAVDVGQGDGILIRADGTDIWIDGGSTDKQDVARYQILPLLRHYGVRRLECCILTHEDEDHRNGLMELLAENGEPGAVEIGMLCLPSVEETGKTEGYREVEKLAEEKKIPVQYLKEGDLLCAGKLRMRCLHPEEDSTYADANERSVTMYLTYGAFSCLLNGDLEGEGEKRMLSYVRGQGEKTMPLSLLHVAHHGSKGATSEEFLRVFRPQYGFVSCGRDNSYGHPHKETLQRLAACGTKLYDTREDGEITFWTNGRILRVRTCLRRNS